MDNRKTNVVNPGFQYRIALTLVMVVIIAVNLVIVLAGTAPQALGLELRLGDRSYYVIALAEALVIFLCWRWSIFTTHRVAGPVYAIGRELFKLRHGDLIININLRPRDEFRETAEDINQSIAHLRDRVDHLKGLVARLEMDPSPEVIRELADALRALRTSDGEESVGVGSRGEPRDARH